MPVRIYDIARKLGIESKEVIARAKELGIVGAKVASSTLDKITAEYLEQQLGYKPAPPPPPAPPAPVSAPVPPPPPPPAPPVVSAPSEAAALLLHPPAVGPLPSPLIPKEGTPSPPTPAVEAPRPTPAPPPALAVAEAPPPAVETLAPPPAEAPSPAPGAPVLPVVAESPVLPSAVAAPAVGAPPSLAPEAKAGLALETKPTPAPEAPAVPMAVPGITPPPPPAVPPSPPAAPAPPPPPAPPPAPRLGEKVGFIALPVRPRPADKTPPPKAPARPGFKPETRPLAPTRDLRPGQRLPPPQTVLPRAPIGAERRTEGAKPTVPVPAKIVLPEDAPVIVLKPPVAVRDLAEHLRRKPYQLIADLMEMNVFATVNQSIDPEIAQRLCAKHGVRFEVERRERGGGIIHAPQRKTDLDADDKPEDLLPRAPVVTIMGHVDHGKTSLLDVVRKTKVAAGEAGGITQHIGAYTITVPHPDRPKETQQITFLDTPGHAAFSSMRARGANVTDIVVLVVAANDGVMPQTLEAINHAQAAKVPIIVAVNKIDHPNANALKVRQQLQEKGLVSDEWGGDTMFADVSALTKQGIDKLLEMIVLQAELLELKAKPNRHAKGNVIESGLEPGGPMATVLVRKGTLKVGDTLVCGQFYGRVRALINAENKRLKEAGPSVAVKVLGLNGVPEAGVEFTIVEDEKTAREICEERSQAARNLDQERRPKITLETLLQTLETESAKVLKIVVKADTQGSVEAIVEALKKIESTKVSLEIVHSAVGTITESDVHLASASKGIIIGFHTRIDNGVTELAKREGVQIKLYAIIYELIDQVKEAMAGLLDPLLKEVVFGVAEVRKIFPLSKGGNVAGCVVASGRIVKGKARAMRRKNLVYEGVIQTLRRFQDEVNEVRAGMECGIRLDGYDDFQPGDTVECYSIEKVPQKL